MSEDTVTEYPYDIIRSSFRHPSSVTFVMTYDFLKLGTYANRSLKARASSSLSLLSDLKMPGPKITEALP